MLNDVKVNSSGFSLQPEQRHIGMVFQDYALFPHLTVAANIDFGLHRMHHTERTLRVTEMLQTVSLADVANNYPHELSGGQQQRLCIARALAVEPSVILMDEPCPALDPIATLAIEDLMRELSEDYSIIIVTHNMQQAARVSNFTAFLMADEDKAGFVVEFGESRQIFTNPEDERTEAYITGRFG